MKLMHLAAALITAAFVSLSGIVAAHAEIRTEWVEYKDGATPLKGYLAYDDSRTGKRPGILLAHYWGGLSQTTLNDARMIAQLGYVVFAEDIYGKDVLPRNVQEMQATSAIYDKNRPLMRARAKAGFDVLSANPMVDPAKIAVVGYCFGGTVGVEFAETGAPIAGLVTVHGSFRDFAPGGAKNIKGRVLILHGAEDEVAPLPELYALINDLRAAKTDWQLELYSGTRHGFTNPGNPSEERADREYKVTMARFLKEIFGS